MLQQDPQSVGAVVSIGSSMPVERERRLRARLVDHDVVPLHNSALRKAIVVPSVLNNNKTTLYDIIISIDGAFDMKTLQTLTNEALVTLSEYKNVVKDGL